METKQDNLSKIIPNVEICLGDKVRVRQNNKIGTLVNINYFLRKEQPFEVVTEDGDHIFCKPEDVKLEALKPQKFLIGDWVRTLDANHTVGEIIAYERKIEQYQIRDLEGHDNTYYDAGLLEPIQKPLYSVGEPVRVIESTDHFGELSTVVGIIWSDKMRTYCYRLENILGTFLEDCIEHGTTENEVEPKELNLAEILRNHIGRTFYCSLAGQYAKVVEVLDEGTCDTIVVELNNGDRISLNSDGSFFKGGDMQLFPTKENRDWVKWDKDYYKYVIVLNAFQSDNADLVKPGCRIMVRDFQEMQTIFCEIADFISKLAEKHNVKIS